MRRLRAAAAADGPRSEALITLLLNNGLRISEALACDIEHLGYDRGDRILRLHRKGGKVPRAPLAPPTAHAVDAYIARRTSGPIFVTASGRRMDRHAASGSSSAWRAPATYRRPPTSVPTASATASPPPPSTPARSCATCKTPWAMPTHAPPGATTAAATASTATRPTPSHGC